MNSMSKGMCARALWMCAINMNLRTRRDGIPKSQGHMSKCRIVYFGVNNAKLLVSNLGVHSNNTKVGSSASVCAANAWNTMILFPMLPL